MIYTVTLNPSIDYVVMVPTFQSGTLNRCSEETVFPGGKGNNVSVVLRHLGIKSTALGFVAGFTGEALEAMLQNKGINTDFVRLEEGNSRINVKLHSASDGVETEINGNGPKVLERHIAELMKKLDNVQGGDTVVLAGSVPASLPENIYEEICVALADRQVRIVVDAQRRWLEDTLKFRPFLVKPNRQELEEFFGLEINSKEDAAEQAKKLCQMGAQQVIVSMGAQGAVFCAEDGLVLFMDAPAGEVINSVGAGDSVVAGFLCAIDEGKSREEAFKLAVYTGSACAFTKDLPKYDDISKLMQKGKNSYEA